MAGGLALSPSLSTRSVKHVSWRTGRCKHDGFEIGSKVNDFLIDMFGDIKMWAFRGYFEGYGKFLHGYLSGWFQSSFEDFNISQQEECCVWILNCMAFSFYSREG
ncbi:hypothetical protein ZWY2020_047925 [Hordeum vulgare]|nr:hypothetical protein ZWY2020_047925 [Hordeum vulgare]